MREGRRRAIDDEKYEEAVELWHRGERPPSAWSRGGFRIGYNRAARHHRTHGAGRHRGVPPTVSNRGRS
jgi:hypothetical protein